MTAPKKKAIPKSKCKNSALLRKISLAVIIAVLFSVMLVGCGEKENEDEDIYEGHICIICGAKATRHGYGANGLCAYTNEYSQNGYDSEKHMMFFCNACYEEHVENAPVAPFMPD